MAGLCTTPINIKIFVLCPQPILYVFRMIQGINIE
jgi:hypothetical protein